MKMLLAALFTLASVSAFAANPKVVIKTSKGEIVAELFEDKAPVTVKNFLTYVDKGHYKGTIFHRVIDGFMIQGGGFDKDMKEKSTGASIKNEATNGLKNEVGTLAMARTQVVDSATAQFFINVADNAFLDHRTTNEAGYGYAVFGKVITGMPVVNQIKSVKTAVRAPYEDVPVEPVVILDITRKK
ncbi:peptidyl-prolyl cis-trans isomerase [Bacteriovorax stolpii]|uniref:Peptidyl-prolyl cis-trans isomerase n=1 Tax=Bacteriovorax stolpii TaxID=960 RepID=A0A2K9NU60_BACTC|nr:peptidylprolyl isomerase [Bacteriovorax stolpii]AUN99032.1 peptidylprolyl isomerase A [Bacteriovorax stolpii]QDK40974.1 peptidyl-prolyl cis-trans isomerase [Bacteriovorax stolpii]TDP55442.1 peptidyl-prolyl cis-trans isomerase A (cyclophilin A)/peptidyl-prolyl cis-trans isomerase B (cyclophilin B) [Bacteriovorax stolpii]